MTRLTAGVRRLWHAISSFRRSRRARSVVAALRVLTPENRRAFIERQCQDPALRREVKRLIRNAIAPVMPGLAPEQWATFIECECLDSTLRADVELMFARTVLALPSEERADFIARCPDVLVREEVEVFIQKMAAQTAAMSISVRPQDTEDKVANLPPEFPVVGVSGCRYRLVEKIAQGGMGVVYRAIEEPRLRQEGPKQRAIKFILPDQSEPSLEEDRFVREIEAVKTLRQPNIVEILDYGETTMPTTRQSGLFFVMPMYEGQTLQALLDEHKNCGMPVPEQVVSTIIIGIATGLKEAHSKQIIHKDMKPSNIFVEKLAAQQIRPVILDFGLAHNFRDRNAVQDCGGTEYYMDGDARRAAATAWSDIYALGLIALEMMSQL